MVCQHVVRPDHINRERLTDLASLHFSLDACGDEDRQRDIREQIGAIEALIGLRH